MQTYPQNLAFIKPRHGRLTIFWTVLGVLGTLAVMPYLFELTPALLTQIPVPLPQFLLLQAIQSAILLSICTYVGLRLGSSVGLDSPLARAFVNGHQVNVVTNKVVIAAIGGLLVGGLIIALDMLWQPFLPTPHQASLPEVTTWKSLLASFYGGITEELLNRLFLMTLIVWLLGKIFSKGTTQPAPWVFWTAVILAAVLFGLGHLPAAGQVWPLTGMVVARTVTLNVVASILFGAIYWRWGLEYAMLAHFCADIALHVIGGS